MLGGGGITGIAWELGLLAGLAQDGVDLLGADLIVGTSAGSVVGAQITSGTPIDTPISGSWSRHPGSFQRASARARSSATWWR